MQRYSSEDGDGYYSTEKLPSGQTIRIEFQEEWSKSKYYYNIYLVTAHKRKQQDSVTLKRTGKDGLKGMFWAREKIKEFEQFIKEEHKGVPVIIFCYWTCNKRRDLYARGLKDLGYNFNNLFGYKVLSKTIRG